MVLGILDNFPAWSSVDGTCVRGHEAARLAEEPCSNVVDHDTAYS